MKKYLVEADQLFIDKFNNSVEYKIGSTLVVDEERKDDLVKRGLAHVISEKTVEEKTDDNTESDVKEEKTVEEKTEQKNDKTKKSKAKE